MAIAASPWPHDNNSGEENWLTFITFTAFFHMIIICDHHSSNRLQWLCRKDKKIMLME